MLTSERRSPFAGGCRGTRRRLRTGQGGDPCRTGQHRTAKLAELDILEIQPSQTHEKDKLSALRERRQGVQNQIRRADDALLGVMQSLGIDVGTVYTRLQQWKAKNKLLASKNSQHLAPVPCCSVTTTGWGMGEPLARNPLPGSNAGSKSYQGRFRACLRSVVALSWVTPRRSGSSRPDASDVPSQ